MQWMKRLIILAVALLVTGAALSITTWLLFRGTPEWYSQRNYSREDMEAAARSAERKFIETRDWAARSRTSEPTQGDDTSHLQADKVHTITIAISEEELNAFFLKWSEAASWDQAYEKYLADPAIVLHRNRLILAGTIKELETVASVHFQPRLDDGGQLDFRLVRVLGGRLPLPEAVWSDYRDLLSDLVEQQLPHWRQSASLHSNGGTNGSMFAAAMGQLLVKILRQEPADPVLILPLDDRRSIPVKLTELSIADRTLTLTVEPLTAAERTALLERIREPAETATAAIELD